MVGMCGQKLQIPGNINVQLLRRGILPCALGFCSPCCKAGLCLGCSPCHHPRGQKPAGRGWGQEHLMLPGSLGASVPSTQLSAATVLWVPRGRCQSCGKAPQGGLGHELIQRKALKMMKQKNQSLPAQTTVTAQLFFLTVETKNIFNTKFFLSGGFSLPLGFSVGGPRGGGGSAGARGDAPPRLQDGRSWQRD